MENKSGTIAPSISLPKGGGAIKGIGETFQPNLFTGTGNFSIPIATSPGRNGFGPQLSLQYSSGNGNGPFGLGWQLSIPRITRKTEKGLPTYTDKDVFVMSGAEDLAPYLDSSGNPVAVPNQNGYSITLYRPRIEGLFARIEKWVRQNDGDVHWRVRTRDNITSIYGKSGTARLADPDNAHHIFEWLLDETFDAMGNHIYYEYVKENPNLRIAKIYEENRKYNQTYIRRILYGNTPDSLDNIKAVGPKKTGAHHHNPTDTLERHYVFEVLFDYGDLPEVPVIPFDTAQFPNKPSPEEWPVREDPFSSFRPGFEIRTLRRCERVLMLHHFKEGELEGAPLVKSTDFEYAHNDDTRLSMLTAVKVTGYRKDPQDGTKYLFRDMPPVTFGYSEFKPQEQRYQSVTANGNDLPPRALNDPNFTLIDLFGDGLPDILNTTYTGYYFWQNLGNGHVARRHSQHEFPADAILSDANVAIGDMGGDGLPDLVVEAPTLSGFYEATPDGKWKPFKRFETMPSFRLDDPNLRLVDLTGDGLSDVLVTADHHFLWYRCKGEQGYDDPKVVERRYDLNEFPDVYFDDPTGRVRLADMTGDGLIDIVLVHNGRIDYWPNLGYGKFGKRITMANAARLDYNFNPQRLFLVDLDGTGCADLVYVDFDSVHFWFNQSGNSWSEEKIIHGTPAVSDSSAIQFADFFGTGTATLVWSYDYNFQPGGNYKVLDFCGGVKPFLLVEMNNNMGASTRVKYAPSTKFYLEDKNAGTPWATNLPFPVQVLEKRETIDHISKTKLVTTFKYHHGYYDGREREFRGFGRVDQYDTEEFEAFANDSLHEGENLFTNSDEAHHLPPVLTKNWFHTGVYFDENLPSSSGVFYDKEDMMAAYRKEFYQGDAWAFVLEDHSVDTGGTPHEAYRALRGSLLHSEVYALDDTDKAKHPFTVSESRYEVKQLQAAVQNGLEIAQHSVYLPVPREGINCYYEKNPIDPRVSHSIVLETNELGNPIRTASVVYGRKIADPSLPSEVTDSQQKMYITYGEVDYTADIASENPTPAYRLRVPYESRSYEITGIAPASDLFNLEEINNKIAGTADIPYETVADGVSPQKRLLSQSRTTFLDDNLNPMPLGQWDSLGLDHQSYQLAFTPTISGAHYAGKVTDAEFSAAGYLHFDGDANWWIPSGNAIYPANPGEHFYVPIGTRDPLGMETIDTFDQYDLLVERRQVRQAAWNEFVATNDYRVLRPVMMTDPNKNRAAVEIDELEMVVKTAIMGKAVGPAEGDTLADPTVRVEYELFNWINHRKPNYVHTFAREQHGAANLKWQESYTYFNGSGGVAMVKAQAHPGKALQVNAGGTVTEVDTDPRWVGNGRTILNNMGNPVRQYEPYFSTTHEYEDETALREIGVTPIFYYDAIGRNIRTQFPNGSFARVEFDPWMQKAFDANDTVKESQWYADRGSPDPATQPEPLNNPERRTAWLAAKHADTPGVTHFD
ncbi:MAG: SpvB/TcaC N-terminal domain-containing protein, partial [Planctomycetota bacterium]